MRGYHHWAAGPGCVIKQNKTLEQATNQCPSVASASVSALSLCLGFFSGRVVSEINRFFPNLLLVVRFYHSNRKVTKAESFKTDPAQKAKQADLRPQRFPGLAVQVVPGLSHYAMEPIR